MDRETIVKGIQECDLNGGLIGNCPYKGILSLLKEQEDKKTISDAIHVTAKQFRRTIVRCRDCKHGKEPILAYRNGCVWCERVNRHNSEDWFCADGERRTDESKNHA